MMVKQHKALCKNKSMQRFATARGRTIKGQPMSTSNSVLTLPRLAVFLIALAMVSCDSFSDDKISPENQLKFGKKSFYVVRGSSIVINVASLIEESFVDATLEISTHPS